MKERQTIRLLMVEKVNRMGKDAQLHEIELSMDNIAHAIDSLLANGTMRAGPQLFTGLLAIRSYAESASTLLREAQRLSGPKSRALTVNAEESVVFAAERFQTHKAIQATL